MYNPKFYFFNVQRKGERVYENFGPIYFTVFSIPDYFTLKDK